MNTPAIAAEACETSKPRATPYGSITATDCAEHGKRSRSYFSLDGRPLVESLDLFQQDRSRDRSLWVFQSGDYSSVTGCSTRHFFVDIASKPVKAFAFGVRGACNEFHWASWGEKRSVIALKHNVQFVYENGVLKPPRKGEKLWKAIEAPHAGPGLSVEDAIPFVETVSPPR